MPRFSGLQCDVLKLYRDYIRTIHQKNLGTAGLQLVRRSFRDKLQYPKRDVQAIENWVRTGKSKLETLQGSDTSISFVNVNQDKK